MKNYGKTDPQTALGCKLDHVQLDSCLFGQGSNQRFWSVAPKWISPQNRGKVKGTSEIAEI